MELMHPQTCMQSCDAAMVTLAKAEDATVAARAQPVQALLHTFLLCGWYARFLSLRFWLPWWRRGLPRSCVRIESRLCIENKNSKILA